MATFDKLIGMIKKVPSEHLTNQAAAFSSLNDSNLPFQCSMRPGKSESKSKCGIEV